jgi:hypothetical protein
MSSPDEEEEEEDSKVNSKVARIEIKTVELSRFSSFVLGCVLGCVVLLFYYVNMTATSAATVEARDANLEM